MALVEVLNLVIRPRSTRRVEQRQKVVVARVRHFCGALLLKIHQGLRLACADLLGHPSVKGQ